MNLQVGFLPDLAAAPDESPRCLATHINSALAGDDCRRPDSADISTSQPPAHRTAPRRRFDGCADRHVVAVMQRRIVGGDIGHVQIFLRHCALPK
ncbi:hypothetical protein [Variovorax sp. Root318D1]|uniref:hypothetical protein n=1 Tax=Variovorax sp. Root318D1 TaxID=1736513 RepID=UPI000AD73E42|nr:hypothetical protein [Variovorax sp. Root318D1]